MAMPTSGSPISFLQMQTEFGGSNPIGFDEYYLDAGLVPSEIFNDTYGYSADVYSVRRRVQSGVTDVWEWYFNSVLVSTAAGGAWGLVVVSGVYYKLGTAQADTAGTSKVDGVAGVAFTNSHWSIQRLEDANATVPTSGTISLNQFYATFKTF